MQIKEKVRTSNKPMIIMISCMLLLWLTACSENNSIKTPDTVKVSGKMISYISEKKDIEKELGERSSSYTVAFKENEAIDLKTITDKDDIIWISYHIDDNERIDSIRIYDSVFAKYFY